MASTTFHALVLRARDHFAGSSRWAYLAVLTLAASHALVVTPFIADSRLESETSLQRSRLAAVESSLGELREALEAVRQETSSTVAPALARLIEDLESDLARLDVTRRQIAARAAAEREAAQAGDESAARPAAGDTTPSPEPTSDVRPFLIEDPDRIADLRDAETPDQLLAALAPLIDELITRPRFFDFERGWQDEALPRLRARLDAAASALPRLQSRFPEAREQWQALAASLSTLDATAGELQVEPPARPYWWARPGGGGIELGLTPEVADELLRPRRLAELETMADRAVGSYSEIVGRVAQAKRELGDPDAGAFGGLDVAEVATFPLFIGLLLGAVIVWRSQRLRELGPTTRLAVENGEPAALRQWLWSVVQWSTPAGASAAAAWRACVLQTLLGYFLAMGWIGLAAVQLRRLDAADHQRLLICTVAGASVVLVAIVHRLVVARRAIMVLDDVAVEQPAVEQPAARTRSDDSGSGGIQPLADTRALGLERDDEFLEVRPLRR